MVTDVSAVEIRLKASRFDRQYDKNNGHHAAATSPRVRGVSVSGTSVSPGPLSLVATTQSAAVTADSNSNS